MNINNYRDIYYKIIQNISNSILFCFYPGTKNTIIIPAVLRYLRSGEEINFGVNYLQDNNSDDITFLYDFTYDRNVLGLENNTVIQNQTIIGENEINYFIWRPSELEGENVIERT